MANTTYLIVALLQKRRPNFSTRRSQYRYTMFHNASQPWPAGRQYTRVCAARTELHVAPCSSAPATTTVPDNNLVQTV